jgi:hypothetical protein
MFYTDCVSLKNGKASDLDEDKINAVRETTMNRTALYTIRAE